MRQFRDKFNEIFLAIFKAPDSTTHNKWFATYIKSRALQEVTQNKYNYLT